VRPGACCALAALVCAAPASAQGPEPAAAEGAFARADRELAEIDTLVATAWFQTALAVAKATRELLAQAEGPEVAARVARLEVLAATAELALGRRAQARACLARALQADPGLALDPAETSPRVVALLREARRRQGLPLAPPSGAQRAAVLEAAR
jgi:hypothetical protein